MESLPGATLPTMRWIVGEALFEPFQLREDAEYFIDVTVPIPLDLAKSFSGTSPTWPFDLRLKAAFLRDPPSRWRATTHQGEQASVITGRLRLGSFAGVLRFSTNYGELASEVVCKKLRYADEFSALLDDIAEKMAELLLTYESPVGLAFVSSEKLAESDAALHFQLRNIMRPNRLPLAIQEILLRPHTALLQRQRMAPIEDIEETDPALIAEQLDSSYLLRGGPLKRLLHGYTPRELPELEVIDSSDTAENRYVKAFLENCRYMAESLHFRMASGRRYSAAREADEWRNVLETLLQADFWRDVGGLVQFPGNSQVLSKRVGYKEIVRYDSALRASLALHWKVGAEIADEINGDARPIHRLYEYWCFLSVHMILRSICRPVHGGDFLSVSADGLSIYLKKGRQSEARFDYKTQRGHLLSIRLFYNRKFGRPAAANSTWEGSYTATFQPDISIVVSTALAAGTALHWLHFDAKYRLEWAELSQVISDSPSRESDITGEDLISASYEKEMERLYLKDDLYQMHTYRDGILGSRGAYVLFPGDGVGGKLTDPAKNLFIRNPAGLSGVPKYSIPSVGAFPLTPLGGEGQTQAIATLLRQAFEATDSNNPYVEEQGYFR